MDTTGTLTKASVKLIQVMLLQPQLAEAIYADVRKGKTYKQVEIQDDGSIYLGETSVKWVNTLFRLDKEISFETFVMRVFGAIAQMAGSETKDKEKIVVNGLSQDILSSMIATGDRNAIVDRLFDTLRFALKNSPLASRGTPGIKQPTIDDVVTHIKFEGSQAMPIMDSTGKNVLLKVIFKPAGYTVSRDI